MEDQDEKFRLCPSCGAFEDLQVDEIYCPSCRTRMLDRCPECNDPIYYPTSRFCPSCGQEYASARR